jgi:hypothetical protein
MTVRAFRWLLVLSILMPLVGVFVSIATQDQLPDPLREYAVAEAAAMPSTGVMVGGLIILAVWIGALVGAYRLRQYGRRLFVLALVAGLAMTPISGPYVDSGWGQLFYQASFVLDGLLVALMYWSPLAERFSGERQVLQT